MIKSTWSLFTSLFISSEFISYRDNSDIMDYVGAVIDEIALEGLDGRTKFVFYV